MDNVDFTQIISVVTKGGPAAIILAIGYVLIGLVREVRGGKLSDAQKADLAAQVSLLKSQVATLTDSMERMENELEKALDLVHSMRYQRDQARIRVEFLEQVQNVVPRTTWPPEPGTASAGPPALDAGRPTPAADPAPLPFPPTTIKELP